MNFLSDKYVASEIEKIRWIYGLRKIIRFDRPQLETFTVESVPEHIFGALILVDYFHPVDCPQINKNRVKELLQWHDLREILSGDISDVRKTAQDDARENAFLSDVLNQIPVSMVEQVECSLNEFDNQKTPESLFAFAIDKAEPAIELYGKDGVDRIAMFNGDLTLDVFDRLYEKKLSATKNFPVLNRFVDFATKKLRQETFFNQSTL